MDQLARKDRRILEALKAKISEIVSRDRATIDFYKNLKAPANGFKRVHVGNFVLLFSVDKAAGKIIFYKFMHHDEAYK